MYIEFKFHSGRVPSFVEKHIPYVINSKYYGSSSQPEINYISDSTKQITREELETILTNAVLFIQTDSTDPMEPIFREMAPEEKVKLISEFL